MGCAPSNLAGLSYSEWQLKHGMLQENCPLGSAPLRMRELTPDESAALVASSTESIPYITLGSIGQGRIKLFERDPAPAVLAACQAAGGRFSDPDFDVKEPLRWRQPGSNPASPEVRLLPRFAPLHVVDRVAQRLPPDHPPLEIQTHAKMNFNPLAWAVKESDITYNRAAFFAPGKPALMVAEDVNGLDVSQGTTYDYELDRGKGGCRPNCDLERLVTVNCFQTATMSSLAFACPETVKTLFGADASLNHHGVYSVRVCVNGREYYTLLDDYLVCTFAPRYLPNAYDNIGRVYTDVCRPFGQQNPFNQFELWPRFVEKAVMKLAGGYAGAYSLPEVQGWLSHGVACQLLSGVPLRKEICFYAADDETIALSKMCTAFGDSDEDWNDWILCAGSEAVDGEPYSTKANGIITSHAYSVVWSGRMKLEDVELHLLHLRNPHAENEWKGDWSDNWKGWKTPLGQQAKHFLIGETGMFVADGAVMAPAYKGSANRRVVERKNDGCFFMCWSDFIEQMDFLRGWGPVSEGIGTEAFKERQHRFDAHRARALQASATGTAPEFVDALPLPQDVEPPNVSLEGSNPVGMELLPDNGVDGCVSWSRTFHVFECDKRSDVPEDLTAPCMHFHSAFEPQRGNFMSDRVAPATDVREWYERESLISGPAAGGWDLGAVYTVTGVSIHLPNTCYAHRDRKSLPRSVAISAASSAEGLLYEDCTTHVFTGECRDWMTTDKPKNRTWEQYPETNMEKYAPRHHFTFDRPVNARFLSVTVLSSWVANEYKDLWNIAPFMLDAVVFHGTAPGKYSQSAQAMFDALQEAQAKTKQHRSAALQADAVATLAAIAPETDDQRRASLFESAPAWGFIPPGHELSSSKCANEVTLAWSRTYQKQEIGPGSKYEHKSDHHFGVLLEYNYGKGPCFDGFERPNVKHHEWYEPAGGTSGPPAGGWDLGAEYIVTGVTVNLPKGIESKHKEIGYPRAIEVRAGGSAEALLYDDTSTVVLASECRDMVHVDTPFDQSKWPVGYFGKQHFTFPQPVRARFLGFAVLTVYEEEGSWQGKAFALSSVVFHGCGPELAAYESSALAAQQRRLGPTKHRDRALAAGQAPPLLPAEAATPLVQPHPETGELATDAIQHSDLSVVWSRTYTHQEATAFENDPQIVGDDHFHCVAHSRDGHNISQFRLSVNAMWYEPESLSCGPLAGGWDLGAEYIVTGLSVMLPKGFSSAMVAQWGFAKGVEVRCASTAEGLLYEDTSTLLLAAECRDMVNEDEPGNEERWPNGWFGQEQFTFPRPVQARYLSFSLTSTWEHNDTQLGRFTLDAVVFHGLRADGAHP